MKTMILSATPKDELHWEQFILQTQNSEKKILWQLDFGWEPSALNVWDTARFQSDLFAIETSVKLLQKNFPLKKHNVSFLHLNQPVSNYLFRNEILEERFEEFLGMRSKAEVQLFEIFCATLLSEYLHRLASILPMEFTPCIVINLAPSIHFHSAFLSQLFCSRRFVYFRKIFSKKKPFFQNHQASIGIVLPQDHLINSEILKEINHVLTLFKRGKQKCSCIPEELLNESWQGIEDLVIFKRSLSPLGIRMLKGFAAAKGRIITMDEKIGFENEIFLEEYIKNLGIK